MIVVTGANGQLGRAVIENLLHRVPANQIVASVREPIEAAALAEQGVEVRRGDFADPGSLAAAFAGAEQVLVVSVNQLGETGRRLHRTAFEAARVAGVNRVLYTSHMGTHADSPFSDHAAAEAVLSESGIPFTSLRHGFYAESASYLIGRGFDSGVIRAPEDGPVSWTARADLAEADAIVLADRGRLEGITPPLTASEAFTLADLAAIATALTGREIERVIISDEEWIDAKVVEGVPRPMAELLLDVFAAARHGDFAAVDPALEELLGRRPRTMREVVARMLEPDSALS